jgi:hypothetical protein
MKKNALQIIWGSWCNLRQVSPQPSNFYIERAKKY